MGMIGPLRPAKVGLAIRNWGSFTLARLLAKILISLPALLVAGPALAREGAGPASATATTFAQTWFFGPLCALAAGGLLSLAYLWRSRQIADRLRNRMEARLKERERIARDLHDTLLQGVQGLMLRFGAIAELAPRDGLFRYEMDEALRRGQQIIGESRDHILELRTTGCSKALITQFERVGGEFESLSETRLLVVTDGETQDLTAPVLDELGKIGCEAIRNAFQHAWAGTIVAEIIYEMDLLRLVVHDDGLGLTEEILREGRRPGHFGLPGMSERARRIGAKLALENRDGLWLEVRVSARMAYEGQARIWERRRLIRAERAQA